MLNANVIRQCDATFLSVAASTVILRSQFGRQVFRADPAATPKVTGSLDRPKADIDGKVQRFYFLQISIQRDQIVGQAGLVAQDGMRDNLDHNLYPVRGKLHTSPKRAWRERTCAQDLRWQQPRKGVRDPST